MRTIARRRGRHGLVLLDSEGKKISDATTRKAGECCKTWVWIVADREWHETHAVDAVEQVEVGTAQWVDDQGRGHGG